MNHKTEANSHGEDVSFMGAANGSHHGHANCNGQVTVNDEPTKNRLYRFCEKKIDQWVKTHGADVNDQPEPEFRVSFNEEDGTKQVSCMTEISWQGALWRGCDLAADEQQAFIHSLKRLQPH